MKIITLKDFILKLVPPQRINSVFLHQKFVKLFNEKCEFSKENLLKLYKEEYTFKILTDLLIISDNCREVANELFEKIKCKRCNKISPIDVEITEELIFNFLNCNRETLNLHRSKIFDLLYFVYDIALTIPFENFERPDLYE